MALILSGELEEQNGCTEWHWIDDTGTYNASTNTGGYGAPNVASTAITSATLYVLPYNYTTGYLFTFTISSGTITAATVTDPAGDVTTITDDLEYTAFPFSEDEPFVINNEWLGGDADSDLPSTVVYFEYTVTDGTNSYATSVDQLITCSVECCVKNAAANLDAGDCDCQNNQIEAASRANIFLDSATWAMERGERDKAYTNLMKASAYCSDGCTNCP